MIRPCKTSDAPVIADIYNHYIQHTTVTFDEKPISTEEIAHRIKNTMMKYPWLVYVREGKVLGYAYASGWREKSAYRLLETTFPGFSIHHGQHAHGCGGLYGLRQTARIIR